MFRFREQKTKITQPDTTVFQEADRCYAAALLAIARSRLPDIEEAKTIAAQIIFLAQVELEKVAPEVKNAYTPVQRAIVAAVYVSISKSGVTHIGKESLTRIMEGTRDFAVHSGEVEFYATIYNTIGKALRMS